MSLQSISHTTSNPVSTVHPGKVILGSTAQLLQSLTVHFTVAKRGRHHDVFMYVLPHALAVQASSSAFDVGSWEAYGEHWKYFFDCMLAPVAKQAVAALDKLPISATPRAAMGRPAAFLDAIGQLWGAAVSDIVAGSKQAPDGECMMVHGICSCTQCMHDDDSSSGSCSGMTAAHAMASVLYILLQGSKYVLWRSLCVHPSSTACCMHCPANVCSP